ncbi:M4 family metallopeptidase [Streptomyces sp. MJP52]|uniref:M4 family metallopeptidase n=1 Tax=Streptomyces sp. MJP52 TaxID=2940555 RepID=UPI002475CD19|nr:M4 family metallopeptidase [Streptomyces sp. MJP52]MDH6229029.1 Zn-dependent metalloprotease [Streptomyces sp. MJP52]
MPNELRVHCAIPPYILEYLLEDEDGEVRQAALNTLLTTARLRGQRSILAAFPGAATPGNGRRTVFDCRNGTNLSFAVLARSEDGPPSTDEAANRAFESLGQTRDFYQRVFARNSIDGRGMRLDGYVHFDEKYNNAFWDGRAMCFGDGDGIIFSDLTGSISVIAHELTHGVTEYTAGLEYRDQPGALNESMSDVFGALVEQWTLNQTAEQADWLIGREIFTPRVPGDALRSLKAPGRAWARDPQPDHMSKYVHTTKDHGGVHYNSGIPNKAFYLTAVTIGGYAWQAPGTIWYEALKASSSDTRFQEFADTTYRRAGELYGADSPQQRAVLGAWQQVGIDITGVPAGAATEQALLLGRSGSTGQEDSVTSTAGQVRALTEKVRELSRDVAELKESVTARR